MFSKKNDRRIFSGFPCSIHEERRIQETKNQQIKMPVDCACVIVMKICDVEISDGLLFRSVHFIFMEYKFIPVSVFLEE